MHCAVSHHQGVGLQYRELGTLIWMDHRSPIHLPEGILVLPKAEQFFFLIKLLKKKKTLYFYLNISFNSFV